MSRDRLYLPVNEPSRLHGERIRKTRLGLGLTQRALAKQFGIDQASLSRIEGGYFDITDPRNPYAILNERMRIWAQMNKGGRKRTYNTENPQRHRRKRAHVTRPVTEGASPFIPNATRFWNRVIEERKMKERTENG